MRATVMMVLACGAMACGDKDGDSGAAGGDATAEALWGEMDGYAGWSQVDPWTGVTASGAAHGAYVQIWVNDVGAEAAAAGGTDFPAGTILVKESYDSEDGAATGVTAMWKGEGTDAAGGWYFAKYSTGGDIELAGADAEGGCAGCHSAGPDHSLAWIGR